MRMRQEQRGFVLSGIALLLVLPAMLLVASCFAIIEMGGEAAALQASADKVFYTGNDIERVVKDLWGESLLIDNADITLSKLADNYRAATGLLVDITPSWMLWIHVINTGENHLAGTQYCNIIENAPGENWSYYFEDENEAFWGGGEPDHDEPVLFVEKIGENLRITIEDYDGIYHSDVYYSDQLLWDWVGGLEQAHVGENTEVEGVAQLRVFIDVRDPRGAVQYSSTVDLG